ncbi:hypothetical protein [Rubritalea profundi]|uniref:Uncharacterized protein n=1 Tax=Rubritalea profundi TaxID=1658618 RepID=A0A2S7U7H4_9BACT|nr:hypothetical protein [Rubritalea profundi]PQJ30173.1 hypothetical protein BSZ32_17975 [Rubritalea profundi]
MEEKKLHKVLFELDRLSPETKPVPVGGVDLSNEEAASLEKEGWVEIGIINPQLNSDNEIYILGLTERANKYLEVKKIEEGEKSNRLWDVLKILFGAIVGYAVAKCS